MQASDLSVTEALAIQWFLWEHWWCSLGDRLDLIESFLKNLPSAYKDNAHPTHCHVGTSVLLKTDVSNSDRFSKTAKFSEESGDQVFNSWVGMLELLTNYEMTEDSKHSCCGSCSHKFRGHFCVMKGQIKVGGGAQETPRKTSLLLGALLTQIYFIDDTERLLVPAASWVDDGEQGLFCH